jgi:hypothetical protein
MRLILLTIALALSTTIAGAVEKSPRCYGAASRDTVKPCHNPDLALKVQPTPKAALKAPNSLCNRLHVEHLVRTCWFGTPKKKASRTIALVGDSHASAWRAGLTPLAKELKWRGISNTRTSCPLSKIPRSKADKKLAACAKWNAQVQTWFKEHPEIETVFVAAATDPRIDFEKRVKGFRDAWKAIPHTVKHILVIRDNPRVPETSAGCIEQAIRDRRNAGTACARPRSSTLLPDPAATAVRRMHAKRIRLIDLSRFFCDSQLCYPVIGGVLVLKDTTHVTSAYATTVAPYIKRAIKKLGLDPATL